MSPLGSTPPSSAPSDCSCAVSGGAGSSGMTSKRGVEADPAFVFDGKVDPEDEDEDEEEE